MRTCIGLDVGTSGCKAAVLDMGGHILGSARRDYHFAFPQKGWVELDPNTVRQKVWETLREIAPAARGAEYLAVSSIGEAMVLLDGADNVLCNGITYLDERGPETMEQIDRVMGYERLQKVTGLPRRVFFSLNRWLWLAEHRPDVLERTKKAFLFGDYITWLLSGERLIDPSTASKTYLLDRRTRQWSPDIAKAFQVPIERFPRVVPTGTVAGKIRPGAAAELGLDPDLKIVVGVHDQSAATLGSGCIRPGDMSAGEGSSESLNLVISQQDVTERFLRQDFHLEPYVLPGTYLVPVGQHTHGTSLRWFVQQLGADFGDAPLPEGGSLFDQAERNCAADAGELYCLPYLTRANQMDSANHSLGMFVGLELSTTRAQMYRALLEGLCFETRRCLEVLGEYGLRPDSILAAGGCTRSDLYMQIKADVLGQDIRVLRHADAGIMAMGMICAVASGCFRDYGEAAEVFVHADRAFSPKADYTGKYRRYLQIHEAARALYARRD